jgi:hypothetical protein
MAHVGVHCAVLAGRAHPPPPPPPPLSPLLTGIAKFKDRTFVSTAGAQAGTPAYMAPEMFDGAPVSEKVGGAERWLLLGSVPFPEGMAAWLHRCCPPHHHLSS